MSCTIDLKNYQTPGAKVFFGRDRGIAVREGSRLDALMQEHETITIRVPEDVRCVGVSFLEEFFVNAVTSLGEKGFREKFKFDNPGPYRIDDDVDAAVDNLLKASDRPFP